MVVQGRKDNGPKLFDEGIVLGVTRSAKIHLEVDVDAADAGLDAGGLPFHKGTYFPLKPGCLMTGSGYFMGL